ncbi:MAG TPA: hypothetical protein VI603_04975, partial [Saprospiraceae bacterium]|nr:hypothetical protein [Saprospiraceae bacterium]
VECIEEVPEVDTDDVTVTDNCIAGYEVTHVSDVSDDSHCPAVITRKYRATDACGNTVTCTQKITIHDVTDPEIACPGDVTVECIEEVPVVDTDDVTVTDNCIAGYEVTHVSDVSDDRNCPEVITRKYRATDACGNTVTCTQKITINDVTDPVIACPADVTVECIEEVPEVDTDDVTVTDNCIAGYEVTHVSDVSDDSHCPAVITRKYRATDACGNTVTCTQKITINDVTDPVIACPVDVTVECIEEVPEVDTDDVTVTDNCIASYEVTHVSDVSDDSHCPAVITRKYRATDACGNTVTCTQKITINDVTDPEITCPADVTVECIEEVPVVDTEDVTVTDNCIAGYEVTHVSDISDDNHCPEVITRKYRATDACGNTVTCTQKITINDVTDPEIACPADVTVECIEEVPVVDTDDVTVTDNCVAGYDVTHVSDVSDDRNCPKVITRKYRATDACGNTVTCTQKITINDVTDPVIVCPADVMVECIEEVPEVDTDDVTVTDNCIAGYEVTHVSDVSDDRNCPAVITRKYRATDACGNTVTCTQKITINDITSPVLTCSTEDLMLECDGDYLGAITVWLGEQENAILDLAIDNCDADLEVTNDYQPGSEFMSCDKVEGLKVIFYVSDACENTSTCTAYIYIDDTVPPVITCAPDTTIECGEPLPVSSFEVMDACDGNPFISGPIDSEPMGSNPQVIIRKFFARDDCDNLSSCTQRIFIEDTTGPSITCPESVMLGCEEGLPQEDVEATDCSGIGTMSHTDSAPSGDDCEMVIVRTFVAMDIYGNSSSCTQHIYISDNIPPTLVCQDDVTIGCNEPMPTEIALVEDNCDNEIMVTYVDEMVGDNTACEWTVRRIFSAVDDCDHVVTCVQLITIRDMEPPMISCPQDRTVNCGDEIPDLATATDDCDDHPFVTVVDEQVIPGECGYTLTRMYRTWDDCGNTTSCLQIITVEDNIAPEVICEDLEVNCTEKTCITFDDIEVNSFAAPVIVSSVNMGDITVDIKAWKKGGVLADAALYNTSAPHPNDIDLGTPNILYGGPGFNDEEPFGYTYSNNQGVGNAIIIQTPGSPVPDDYLLSDSLVFTFSEPVFIESFVGVDFELNQVNTGAGIFLYDENGISLGFTPFSATIAENNSLEEIGLRMNRVKKLKVYYGTAVPASGGVARLCFVHVPEPESFDACTEVELMYEETMTVLSDCMTQLERTFDAVDGCGNENNDACTQIITIETDSHQPDIICPADINLNCEELIPDPDPDGVAVTDDCSAEENILVEWVEDVVEGSDCEMVIRRIYRAEDECGNVALCAQFITRTEQVELVAELLLAGPLKTDGTMSTSLRSANLLPNAQPYNVPPYNYAGSEVVIGSLPANMTDWILMTLRDENTMAVVATRAALLLSDGHIVDVDGISPVSFNAPPDEYFVAVHHRNHLDFISDATVDFTSAMGIVDFTTMGDAGMTFVTPPGVYAMIKGDVTKDHLVKYNGSNNDKNAILTVVGILTPNNVVAGYNKADVNMDGLVKYNGSNNDKNAVLSSVGLLTPNNIVQGDFY